MKGQVKLGLKTSMLCLKLDTHHLLLEYSCDPVLKQFPMSCDFSGVLQTGAGILEQLVPVGTEMAK